MGWKIARICPTKKPAASVSVEYTLRDGYNLPPNPGGGRVGPPSASIEKIAVSHRPVGHSLLGGNANSLSGGGGVEEYPPFV